MKGFVMAYLLQFIRYCLEKNVIYLGGYNRGYLGMYPRGINNVMDTQKGNTLCNGYLRRIINLM